MSLLWVYWSVSAVLFVGIVWLGLSGRWSDDSWPAFALLTPWFWPLLAPLGLMFTIQDAVIYPLWEWYRTGDKPWWLNP